MVAEEVSPLTTTEESAAASPPGAFSQLEDQAQALEQSAARIVQRYPLIALINESTVLTDDQVRRIAAALAYQVTQDFEPVWNAGAELEFYSHGQQPPAAAWQLVFLDNSDMAGALGYHDLTAQGLPLGKVFASTDRQYGLSSSVTASHELLEMLADPWISTCMGPVVYQGNVQRMLALEVGDPVEADQYGYLTPADPSWAVSDFVTPAYFRPGSSGPYDFQGRLSGPLQLLAGGYQSYFDFSSSGWTQVTAQAEPSRPGEFARERPQPGSRRERRTRGARHWQLSEPRP